MVGNLFSKRLFFVVFFLKPITFYNCFKIFAETPGVYRKNRKESLFEFLFPNALVALRRASAMRACSKITRRMSIVEDRKLAPDVGHRRPRVYIKQFTSIRTPPCRSDPVISGYNARARKHLSDTRKVQ